MKNIFYALVGLFLWVSCEETDEHLPPQFNYEIPPTELSDDVLVGALYYNYATADWAKKYTNTPQLGQYSALSAETFAVHGRSPMIASIDTDLPEPDSPTTPTSSPS